MVIDLWQPIHCSIHLSYHAIKYVVLVLSVSIVTFFFIAVLIVSEIRYHADTELKYDYQVDGDADR